MRKKINTIFHFGEFSRIFQSFTRFEECFQSNLIGTNLTNVNLTNANLTGVDLTNADLINAGKQTITSLPGAVLFDSAISFSMIRGNHIHLSVLGAMQVAENGDIANWKIPGKMVKGMGGAMDLVTSSNNIIVAMTHTNRQGQSKLLKRFTLPITGVSCVKKIVTDLAVIEVTNKGFKLTEVAPGVSEDEIINSTDADLIIDKNLRTMVL